MNKFIRESKVANVHEVGEVKDGDTIACWFSCGCASAVATKLILDEYRNRCNVRVLNNFVADEHEDNRRFLKDVEKWLDIEIEIVTNPKYPNCSIAEIFTEQKMMSTHKGYAPCTRFLKQEARLEWEKENHFDWLVLGYTAEKKEKNRALGFAYDNPKLLTPLIDMNYSKQDCFDTVISAGIEIPYIYKQGFENANCIGCVKATGISYWQLVREKYPEVFEQRAKQSREIGCRLTRYKGKRIFLDELPLHAKGNKLKDFNFSCSLFCEG